MKTTAAVLVETGKPLVVDAIEIPPLRPGQVLVKIVFSGVCHTQLLESRGYRGHDPYLPHCLGHEAGGVVEEVGLGVTKCRPGDRVVCSWIQGSGANVPGTEYRWNGRTVNAGGITTFMRHGVISENRLTVIPQGFPLHVAAMLGCAAATGIGAVWNVACPAPGQSLAVFGLGGVGLCAVQAAALAGAHPVVAVDPVPQRRLISQSAGATHVLDPGSEGFAEQFGAICPGGVDCAIEASGRPAAMQLALQSARSRGGVAVVVGNARHGERIDLDPKQLNLGKRLLGTWGGDTQTDRDIPRFCQLIDAGRLTLDPLLQSTYPLERINQALDDLEAHRALRPLIDMEA